MREIKRLRFLTFKEAHSYGLTETQVPAQTDLYERVDAQKIIEAIARYFRASRRSLPAIWTLGEHIRGAIRKTLNGLILKCGRHVWVRIRRWFYWSWVSER